MSTYSIKQKVRTGIVGQSGENRQANDHQEYKHSNVQWSSLSRSRSKKVHKLVGNFSFNED